MHNAYVKLCGIRAMLSCGNLKSFRIHFVCGINSRILPSWGNWMHKLLHRTLSAESTLGSTVFIDRAYLYTYLLNNTFYIQEQCVQTDIHSCVYCFIVTKFYKTYCDILSLREDELRKFTKP